MYVRAREKNATSELKITSPRFSRSEKIPGSNVIFYRRSRPEDYWTFVKIIHIFTWLLYGPLSSFSREPGVGIRSFSLRLVRAQGLFLMTLPITTAGWRNKIILFG
jgi:hypothetical protein